MTAQASIARTMKIVLTSPGRQTVSWNSHLSVCTCRMTSASVSFCASPENTEKVLVLLVGLFLGFGFCVLIYKCYIILVLLLNLCSKFPPNKRCFFRVRKSVADEDMYKEQFDLQHISMQISLWACATSFYQLTFHTSKLEWFIVDE